MKREYFDYMDILMEQNDSIYFLMAGLGYPRTQEFLDKYPDRAFNTEASEQTALDMAVGLAYGGKIPVIYTISSFYWRAAETIRTYLDHEKLHAVLIGAGVKEEYGEHDGYSHSATDIPELFNIFENITQFYPDDKNKLVDAMNSAIVLNGTSFINIHR